MIVIKEILQDIHPKEWLGALKRNKKVDVHEFRNLTHFKEHLKSITPRKGSPSDERCGISYEKALDELIKGKPQLKDSDYLIIKENVKNVLQKRGLISENIYESFKYDIEGEIVDVGKVVEGDPECFLTPAYSYTNYFYELYISVSYHSGVSNEDVMRGIANILATVELLEAEHIYIKITLVLPIDRCADGHTFMGIVPMFGHRDEKSAETMSSVLNDRLLRKFFFAILEDTYKSKLNSSYGYVIDLKHTISPDKVDPVELASSILDRVLEPGTR